ncbi:MAG: MlaD family protein, partial [Pseudomonadota bacterium]
DVRATADGRGELGRAEAALRLCNETDSDRAAKQRRAAAEGNVAALMGAAMLVYVSVYEQGVTLTIDFAEGHGLKTGDTLRYRGIEVGRVKEISLADDLKGIRVALNLRHNAASLAREGSRFWIVRPQVALSGASGLDTVIGANYLQVLPGQGDAQTHFSGLEMPPFAEMMETGGLTIRLTTPSQSSLRAGAPMSYRQVNVGTITKVRLAKDASAVEVDAYIKPAYTSLIRENTKFWKSGGARFDFGWLSGPSFQLDSVESLIVGGITLAVPPTPGKQAKVSHKFRLYDEPAPAWREWTAYLALEEQNDVPRPQPKQLRLSWKGEGYLDSWLPKTHEGWVLPVENGVLGPESLLSIPSDAKADSIKLELAGEPLEYNAELQQVAPGIVILEATHAYAVWPLTKTRVPSKPEDTILIGGTTRYLAADDYQDNETDWLVSSAIELEPSWRGACVVAAADGALLGVIFIDDKQAKMLKLGNIGSDASI